MTPPLADIDYNLVRLNRSAERRESLAAKGLRPAEAARRRHRRKLTYYKRLRQSKADSNQRQSDCRRLLPGMHEQLKNLRGNLTVRPRQARQPGIAHRRPGRSRRSILRSEKPALPVSG